MDGYIWSGPGKIAGLRFKALVDGKEILSEGKDPVVTDSMPGKLHIAWPLTSFAGALVIDIDERKIKITLTGAKSADWFLDLSAGEKARLPFKK